MRHESLPVVIIGAGPVGLAAAAHVLSRNLTPLVLEAGPRIGAGIRRWGHSACSHHGGSALTPRPLSSCRGTAG
jgi:flavin-dependent dehydrogenase